MRLMKFLIIVAVLLLTNINNSIALIDGTPPPRGDYGIECLHNDEPYALVMVGSCPLPPEESHAQVTHNKHLSAHDPDCVLTESPSVGF